MERRELIQWLLATGGLAAFNRLSAHDLATLGRDAHAQMERAQRAQRALTVLDARSARTVTAAAECIIPASDTPGATDAGVTAFIDTIMDAWYTAAERDRLLAGIAELNTRSQTQHGRGFADVPLAAQVSLLEALDGDVVALRQSRGAAANDHWFAMLKYLTVWGYCTSEPGMRRTLRSYPPPMRYDGAAPVRAS